LREIQFRAPFESGPAPLQSASPYGDAGESNVANGTKPTCEDCYFKRAGLCALMLSSPCPTFRYHGKGSLVPPRQAALVALAPRAQQRAA